MKIAKGDSVEYTAPPISEVAAATTDEGKILWMNRKQNQCLVEDLELRPQSNRKHRYFIPLNSITKKI
jgi:hypothetical protein